jgi:hypothetical protein
MVKETGMSWRVIFGILIVTAGASAWGGLRLGDWLIANGPEAPVVQEMPELSGQTLLDANGKPYTAQPPQPLVNGQQGIPKGPDQVQWSVAGLPLATILANNKIALATTQISMEQAIALADAQNNGSDGGQLQGMATLGNVPGVNVPGTEVQPIEVAPPPPPPAVAQAPSAATQGNWQAQLRRELQACSNLGFFDRPSCAWAARNRYCEPNNAWGRTADCPSKNF